MPSQAKINRLREKLPGDEKIETTFRRLRQDGHSRSEAVRLILDVLDVSLSEAKTLLLTSDTWAEARAELEGNAGPNERDAAGTQVPPAPA